MSRVHDALRRAEQTGAPAPSLSADLRGGTLRPSTGTTVVDNQPTGKALLELIKTIPFNPSPDALVIDPLNPNEAPT